MRKVAVLAGLFLLFAAISLMFWYSEFVYSLPTPVPDNYKQVAKGRLIRIPGLEIDSSKPVFLHFFNPGCPCSRFNIPQFRSLIKKYGDKVNFAVVVMTDEDEYTGKEIQDRFNAEIPVLFDTSLASTCGVYSTPQAVILDTHGQLYYRGNYNKTRYCTDPNTNYANIALDSLLNQRQYPHFNQFALKAYGCTLPECKKTESN
jgi:hypothetical protein